MDAAIINGAGTVQLVGLALVVIMVILLGIRAATTGSKGMGSLLGEIAGIFVAVWFIARPNDILGLLLKSVGGIAQVTMPK